MLGLFGYEEELDSSIGHGNGHLPARHSAKWKRQNRYLTSLRATGVCPCQPWGEPDTSLDFGMSSIVKLNGSV